MIPGDALRSRHVPANDADWDEIIEFAHTFDGYEHFGSNEACGNFCNAALERFDAIGEIPATLDELRACLFYEARRWRHAYLEGPGEAERPYVSALLSAIRQHAEQGST